MSDDERDFLVCTRCDAKQEFYSRIVYSQGSRVCVDCKEETKASDNAAFDRYIDLRNSGAYDD